jgi:hypothetical protein
VKKEPVGENLTGSFSVRRFLRSKRRSVSFRVGKYLIIVHRGGSPMKKQKNLLMLLLILSMTLFIVVLVQHFRLQADEAKLKVLINNSPTKLQPMESKGHLYIPLSFLMEEGKTVYQVKITYDKAKGTITIEKVRIGEKYREKTKCLRCDGTGKCQACYPAGSGENANGGSCSVCDGTGKCQRCNGEKEY